jgi:putative hemolysin
MSKNNQIILAVAVVILLIAVVGVFSYSGLRTIGQDRQAKTGGAGIANPASVNCVKLGGRVDIRTDQTGGQIGYCQFKSGQECEEWALLRNECGLSPSSQMGILEGKVTVGPICPVERVGVPCPVPAEAYTSREILVYKADGTTEVARQHFTKDGSYKFELAPGTYVINIPRQGVGGTKDLPQTVIIKAGETLELNFSIDTGIR